VSLPSACNCSATPSTIGVFSPIAPGESWNRVRESVLSTQNLEHYSGQASLVLDRMFVTAIALRIGPDHPDSMMAFSKVVG
jgi:hypothetical protein